MPAVAILKALLKLDNKQFKAGMKGAKAETTSFGSQLAKVGSQMSAAFVVTGIMVATRKLISLGSTITDLAKQAGVSTDAWQGLELASTRAGIESAAAGTMFTKIAVALGEAKEGVVTYTDAFKALGIQDVSTLSVEGALLAVAKAMSTAERGSVEFAAALSLIGTKSGTKMIQVMERINEVGFKGLIADAREAGTLIENITLQRLDELEDRLQVAKKQAAAAGGAVAGAVMDVGAFMGRQADGDTDKLKTFLKGMLKGGPAGGFASVIGADAGTNDRTEAYSESQLRRIREGRIAEKESEAAKPERIIDDKTQERMDSEDKAIESMQAKRRKGEAKINFEYLRERRDIENKLNAEVVEEIRERLIRR